MGFKWMDRFWLILGFLFSIMTIGVVFGYNPSHVEILLTYTCFTIMIIAKGIEGEKK